MAKAKKGYLRSSSSVTISIQRNLVIVKHFCQSPGPPINRGSTANILELLDYSVQHRIPELKIELLNGTLRRQLISFECTFYPQNINYMHLYCQSLSQYLKKCANRTNIATNRHTNIAKQSYTTRRRNPTPRGFPGKREHWGGQEQLYPSTKL